MNRKFFHSLALVGVLSTSLATSSIKLAQASTYDGTADTTSASISTPENDETDRGVPWAKGVWYLAKKVANGLYNVKPVYTKTKYGETSSPGSIVLNGPKYGASAQFKVNSLSTKHSLALYSLANPVDMFGKKYSLLVVNPHGNNTINTSITPGVYRGFKFGLKGVYKCNFISNTKTKMAPFVAYRYDGANSVYGTHSMPIDQGNNEQSNSDGLTTSNSAYTSGYGNMERPSWRDNFVSQDNKNLSVNSLFNEVKDGNKTVYSTKHYLAGDVIVVRDLIDTSSYNPKTNETTLTFKSSSSSDIKLRYKGNLTTTLKPGKEFKQDMKVKELGSNPEFRLPEYMKSLLDNKNKAPEFVQ